MFWTEAAQSVRAAWRLALFDTSAMAEFNLTTEGFWRSFQVYLLLCPAYLAIVLTPTRLEAISIELLLVVKLASYVVSIVVSTVLLGVLCHLLKVGDRFVPLIVAGNWGAVLQIAVLLPVALLAAHGLLPGRGGAMVQTSAYLAVVFYAWFVTRTALGVSGLAAVGVIVADKLVSELIDLLISQPFGVPYT